MAHGHSRNYTTLTDATVSFARRLTSGNCTYEEMLEFVLQYAVHAGWPKASYVQGIVMAMGKKVSAGLPYDG